MHRCEHKANETLQSINYLVLLPDTKLYANGTLQTIYVIMVVARLSLGHAHTIHVCT